METLEDSSSRKALLGQTRRRVESIHSESQHSSAIIPFLQTTTTNLRKIVSWSVAVAISWDGASGRRAPGTEGWLGHVEQQ